MAYRLCAGWQAVGGEAYRLWAGRPTGCGRGDRLCAGWQVVGGVADRLWAGRPTGCGRGGRLWAGPGSVGHVLPVGQEVSSGKSAIFPHPHATLFKYILYQSTSVGFFYFYELVVHSAFVCSGYT